MRERVAQGASAKGPAFILEPARGWLEHLRVSSGHSSYKRGEAGPCAYLFGVHAREAG